MLNYVWFSLVILGILAGVSYDVNDSVSDTYRNGKAITVNLTQTPGGDSLHPRLSIQSSVFNKFYGANEKDDVVADIQLSHKQGNEYTLFMKTDNNIPEIWKTIAGSSGKANDISGNLTIQAKDTLGNAIGLLVLDQTRFVKVKEITNASLDYAETAVKIALGLIGIMAMWLGVMKVAEEAGLIKLIAKALTPVTKFLFPSVPADHPAMGSMIMNISANFLGLGNAATPFGLKAMQELDTLNTNKGTASDPMVMFLAINTAGLNLIPATAIAVRAASGSADPAAIIGTTIFGSACATATAIILGKTAEAFLGTSEVTQAEKKSLFKKLGIIAVVLAVVIASISLGVFNSLSSYFGNSGTSVFKDVISTLSVLAIPTLITIFITYGLVKKVKVYETFVEGAKEGFNTAVRIIPYLVAMLMAIGIFRAGGAMDWLIAALMPVTNFIGMPAEALPMALMRPLSGSGSLGIMTEIISVHGADSFMGMLVSTFYGSTETTFYVLAVYFGSVNIKNTRHALPLGLLADTAGILGALFIVKLLFG